MVRTGEGLDVVDAVRALTAEGRGADVVIEAVATPATWEQAVAMVRRGGVVNFLEGRRADGGGVGTNRRD